MAGLRPASERLRLIEISEFCLVGHQKILTSILLTQYMYLNILFIVQLIRISEIHFSEIMGLKKNTFGPLFDFAL